MHPKNTTPPSPAQHRMLTIATDSATGDGEDRHPFAVNAGIEVEEALNRAGFLLDAVDHVATVALDRRATAHDLVAIRFIASASQALLAANLPAIEQGGAQ
ncbi:DUF3077 domain-containing protein [Pseudomonas typographi]|uniref:DUF3077 domain-containing protein n=1 Tax=Pseudomonas typographi TaxID=2715964 RepID=UPI0016847692|nr:DUF3077 domain-containing protein [Pseudomonas typographi]MBD1553596.1 DUF3077 domain-containing protein [Pseudomonas typographi]